MSITNNVKVFRWTIWIVIFSIAGCTTVQPTTRHNALAQWVGMSFYDAIYQLGRPVDVYSDGLTGRVLVYPAVSSLPVGSLVMPEDSLSVYDWLVWDSSLDRTPPTFLSQQCDMIFVDKDGYVYSFQSNESDRQVRIAYEEELIVGGIIAGALMIALLVMSGGDN